MTLILVRDGKLLCSVWRDHASVFGGRHHSRNPDLDHALPGTFRVKPYRAGASAPATTASQRPGVSLPRGNRPGTLADLAAANKGRR